MQTFLLIISIFFKSYCFSELWVGQKFWDGGSWIKPQVTKISSKFLLTLMAWMMWLQKCAYSPYNKVCFPFPCQVCVPLILYEKAKPSVTSKHCFFSSCISTAVGLYLVGLYACLYIFLAWMCVGFIQNVHTKYVSTVSNFNFPCSLLVFYSPNFVGCVQVFN